jgi:hypothetical protein
MIFVWPIFPRLSSHTNTASEESLGTLIETEHVPRTIMVSASRDEYVSDYIPS